MEHSQFALLESAHLPASPYFHEWTSTSAGFSKGTKHSAQPSVLHVLLIAAILRPHVIHIWCMWFLRLFLCRSGSFSERDVSWIKRNKKLRRKSLVLLRCFPRSSCQYMFRFFHVCFHLSTRRYKCSLFANDSITVDFVRLEIYLDLFHQKVTFLKLNTYFSKFKKVFSGLTWKNMNAQMTQMDVESALVHFEDKTLRFVF